MRIPILLAALCLSLANAGFAADAGSAAKRYELNIARQPLNEALKDFARQTGLQVARFSDTIDGSAMVGPLAGQLSAEQALRQLLSPSGLTYKVVNDRTVAVMKPGQGPVQGSSRSPGSQPLRLARPDIAAAQAPDRSAGQTASAVEEGQSTRGVPEILVKGRKSLNTDIERTEDDAQPYVVFGREEIQRSQAVNLDEFLKTRLPMNVTDGASPITGTAYAYSSVNLRGLGSNQTLILVDGRRMPGVASMGSPGQPDLNGIPLGAIERIEVLPSTGGGIHGGSATGGVVNVILRRDYLGVEARVTHNSSFDTDAGNTRIEANGGFALESGRTQVMVMAAHSKANVLTIGDRDFTRRGLGLQLDKNPSAVIGSRTPPLGATPNIRSSSGAPLTLDMRYGGASLGYNNTYIPPGYTGPDSDGGAALLRNAGSYNLNLPDGVNGLGRSLTPASSMKSASFNIRRDLGPRLDAFLDVSSLGQRGRAVSGAVPNVVSNIPGDAPNNPFEEDINVRFPAPNVQPRSGTDVTTLRATGGLIFRLPGEWVGELDHGWSRSRLELFMTTTSVDFEGSMALQSGEPSFDGRPALNALQEGNTNPVDFSPYLLPIPTLSDGPYDTVLKDTTLRASGPLFRLPAGPLMLSFMAERRRERIDDAYSRDIDSFTREPFFFFFPHRSQDADSCLMEARAPLVRGLEVQASVRHDRYQTRNYSLDYIFLFTRDEPPPPMDRVSTELKSTDYTVGLRYSPLEDLTLRASFGTGFLPPSVIQIVPTLQTFDFPVDIPDPQRGYTDVYVGLPYQYNTGGSPSLRPETSESFSAGLILTPRQVPGLRLSVDYTRIDKIDEIQLLGPDFFLQNEALFPDRIIRAPRDPADPPGWAGRILVLDLGLVNVATTSVEAYDIQADYVIQVAEAGSFRWYALATWQKHYRNRLLPEDPEIDSVGFSSGPLEWRGNAGVTWDRGPWSLQWNAQFYDSHFVYSANADPVSAALAEHTQGSATIPRQIYHDLIFGYRFGRTDGFRGALLSDTELTLGIQNVLDKSPPILPVTNPGGGGYSGFGDPRLRRYSVSLVKRF